MRVFALIMALVYAAIPVNMADSATHQIIKTVNGRAITFEAPQGMCAFDPQYPTDKNYLDYMGELNKPDNTVVLVFTECSVLENSRINSETILSNYEVILFPSGIGKNDIFARNDFLQEMKEIFQSDGEVIADDVVEKIREKIADAEAGTIGQLNSLGVLASTDEALVTGITTVVEYVGKKPVAIAVAIAFTVLNGVPLSVNWYRNPYQDETTIADLVDHVQRHVKTLVAANADVATSLGGSSIDWSQVLQKALIGGFIGLVIAVVFGKIQAIRKRKT